MIRIADIIKESTVDGEGWRYVIFTQGCSHNCKDCHNPQTHDFNGGKDIKVTFILEDILNNPLIDGITLSGGDPFFQASKLIELCKAIKNNNLTIWAYTGFIFDEFMKFKNNLDCDKRINKDMLELLNYIDVVVDGPYIQEQRTLQLKFRGSTNQRLIDVKNTFKNNKIIEYKLEQE